MTEKMKAQKKISLNIITTKGGNNQDAYPTHGQNTAIRIKGIAEADRQKLRIPSYQYILP